jgi:hypothetical protein
VLRHACLLFLLSTGVFLLGNTSFNGSLRNPTNLSGELKSPPDSLYEWNIGTQAPFKYRLVHRSVILGTYHAVAKQENNQLFFRLYQIYSLIFQVAGAIVLYLLLRLLKFEKLAFWGAALFAVMPPMLMAYSVPVHTREDMLAYVVLSAGLIFILKNNRTGIAVTFLLGVLCRETLLILPLVNLLFNRKQSVMVRVAIISSSLIVFFAIRFLLGAENYDVWEGLKWNMSHVFQVAGFTFVSFGFLWLPFLLWMIRPEPEEEIAFFHQSAPVVLAVILITTFLGGIFNEIRLLYLLAPWVIVGSVAFYRSKKATLQHVVMTRGYLLFSTALLVAFGAGTFLLTTHLGKIIPPSEHNISYDLWAVITSAHLYLSCASLPLLFSKK